MTPPAIVLENVSKQYRIYDAPRDRLKQTLFRGFRKYFREHEALQPTTLTIRRGETVGLVGLNGSGKSTLLQIICGTLQPTSGRVTVNGRLSALLELGAGFNPEFTGEENVFLNASILGLGDKEIRAKYDSIVAFSGLDAPLLERPVKTYSSGMYVRLAFAVAIAVEPDILVVDEALAVGDEAFQRKCYARIAEMQARGVTILFVSHSANLVMELCGRAVLLDGGAMLMDGPPREVIASYHRLIYAPEKDRAAVRAGIVSGECAPRGEAAEDGPAPESRVVYTPDGGEIVDCAFVAPEGMAAGVASGSLCEFRYRMRFDRAAEGVRFAMIVKTKTGQELAGAVCHAYKEQLPSVAAGDVVEARFSFRCPLREGVYYLNCGVMRMEEGSPRFIHRIVDACSFRVLPSHAPRGDMEPKGMLDLDIAGRMEKVG